MSQAITRYVKPAHVLRGNKSNAIYAKLGDGTIYKLKASVPAKFVRATITMIKEAEMINLKHWTKCGGAA